MLNDQSEEQKDMLMIPHILYTSASKKEIQDKGYLTYCENPALSLKTPNCVYKALGIPTYTPDINDVGKQNLLDVLCWLFDYNKNEPKNKNELREAWDNANEKKAQI